jgi:uncharacterized protein (DUF1501 family)
MARLSRRELFRRAGALSLAAPIAPFALNLAAMANASAATPADYKALVCLFLTGGNDAYNTLLATDTASWSAYNTARNYGNDPIALAAAGTPANPKAASFSASLGGVLPIAPAHAQGRSFALHPMLGTVRDLFGAGRLAVVSNVGAIVRPMTKADYTNLTFPRPPKLFSHADQQSYWQTFDNSGTARGWGGRFADLVLSGNQHAQFSAVSIAGNAPWLVGQQARSYQLATTGSIHVGGAGSMYGSALVQQTLQSLASSARTASLIEQDHAATVARSITGDSLLSAALPGAGAGPWGTAGLAAGATDPLLTYRNPDTGLVEVNPIAQQLQAVARMIAARGALGMSRQVFFVNAQDFDTHDGQPRRHAVNMARIAHAFAYFDATLAAMGVGNQVTTFTASDFGRGFISNGTGTDHGYGAHHLVMGGAVRGGDLYGTFPVYGTPDRLGNFNSPDQVTNGAMLPTTSIDQYAATLGAWFGVSATDLTTILPNLGSFDPASRAMGFMTA